MDCHAKTRQLSLTMEQIFLKAFKMYEPTASGSDEEDEEQAVTFTDVGNVRSTDTDQGHFSLPLYLRYTLILNFK